MDRCHKHVWCSLVCALLSSASQAWTAVESPEGKLELTGNLQFDSGRIALDGAGAEEHFGWRRRRLGFDWTRGKQFELAFEYDFAAHAVTDAWLKWKTASGWWQFGQFKQPFVLDELNSDKRTLLLEPGLPHAFAISRRLAVGWLWNPGAFGLQLNGFGRNLDGTPSSNGGAARTWWTPQHADERTLHLGLALSHEDVADGGLALNVRPESRLTALRAARTPRLADTDSLRRLGLEALWLDGPWYGQAELVALDARRTSTVDYAAFGWYAQLGRSFGPGRRHYKHGTIQSIDRCGTLELGLRAASVDLDDGAVQGGRAHTLAFGATWYLQPETRLMTNIVDVRRRDPGADFQVLEMRVQVVF